MTPPPPTRPFSKPPLALTAAHSACEQILENVYPQASYRRAAETQENLLSASRLQALAVTRRAIEDELRVADGTETVAQRTRAEVSENAKSKKEWRLKERQTARGGRKLRVVERHDHPKPVSVAARCHPPLRRGTSRANIHRYSCQRTSATSGEARGCATVRSR